MADPIIKVKRSAVAGKIPTIADLDAGEFAINTNDGKVFIEKTAGITTIIAVNPWNVGIGSTSFDMHHLNGRVSIGTDNPVALLTVGDVSNTVTSRGSLSIKTIPSSGTLGEAALYIEEKTGSEGWYLSVDVDGDLNFNNSSSSINSIEFIDATDDVLIRKGALGILTTSATDALTVLGNARITGVTTLGIVNGSQLSITGVSTFGGTMELNGALRDINNVLGTDGQVLKSTGAGVSWGTASGGASALDDLTDVTITSAASGQFISYNGSAWVNVSDTRDGGSFNIGITTAVYDAIDGGIGGTQADTNNIFIGPGAAYTFAATAGKRYIIESIQLANVHTADVYLVARHDYNGLTDVPMAQRVVIPYGGALELLENPIVANPSDEIRIQALDGVASTANGVNGGLDAFLVYTEKTSTAYIGTGATITSTDQILYTASSQTVIESITATNYSLTVDVNVDVSIFRSGNRFGYLCKGLTVPKNSVVEVISKPKYLAINDSIRATRSADGMAVRISGKTY